MKDTLGYAARVRLLFGASLTVEIVTSVALDGEGIVIDAELGVAGPFRLPERRIAKWAWLWRIRMDRRQEVVGHA